MEKGIINMRWLIKSLNILDGQRCYDTGSTNDQFMLKNKRAPKHGAIGSEKASCTGLVTGKAKSSVYNVITVYTKLIVVAYFLLLN